MDRRLPTRRERLRVEMADDILAAARELLSADGVNAVSLRAIARRIGVSPAAIYRYFPSLNALIGAVHDDVLDELCGAIACARDGCADDGSVTRLRSMVEAFRGWALQHPAEFRFSLGPGRGDGAREGRQGQGQRNGSVTAGGPYVPYGPGGQPAGAACEQSVGAACGQPASRILTLANIFLAEFSRSLQHHQANTTFLSAWIKIYGLVVLENSGDLGWIKDYIETIFNNALAEFAGQLPGEYGWSCR